jgi:hypothetical protein
MSDKRELQLLLTMKDEASKELKGFADGFEKHRKTIGTAMTVVGGAITGFMGLSVKAFADSEKQLARVDQTIRNVAKTTGADFQSMSDEARNFGASLQALAGFSDEAGAESFSKMLVVAGGDMTEAAKLAGLAADLSVAKQVDLDSATRLVAGAMAGNTRILKEYCIELEDGAGKQEVVGALMDTVGGQAKKFGETFEGQLKILRENFGDLQERIGGVLIPVLINVLEKIRPIIDKTMEWIEKNKPLAEKIILVVAVLGALMAVLGPLLLVLPGIVAGFTAIAAVLAFLVSPIGLVIGALILLGILIKVVKDNWAGAVEGMKLLWGMLVEWVKAGVNNLGEAFGSFVDSIYASMVGTWEGIKEAFKSGINWVIDKLNAFVRSANAITSKLNVVPGVNIPMIPEIPKLAKGGIVTRPTTALIGEAGPEAVIPLKKMGAMGGITVNVYGDVSGNELISKVSEGIMKNLMLQQRVAI